MLHPLERSIVAVAVQPRRDRPLQRARGRPTRIHSLAVHTSMSAHRQSSAPPTRHRSPSTHLTRRSQRRAPITVRWLVDQVVRAWLRSCVARRPGGMVVGAAMRASRWFWFFGPPGEARGSVELARPNVIKGLSQRFRCRHPSVRGRVDHSPERHGESEVDRSGEHRSHRRSDRTGRPDRLAVARVLMSHVHVCTLSEHD